MYKAFLIDLDGTAYVGDKVVLETVDFVKRCKDNGIRILFLTNNASKTREGIYSKLLDMGYDVAEDEIYTSAIAMASYLKHSDIVDNVYVIGDEGLKNSLNDQRISYYSNLNYLDDGDIDKLKSINIVIKGYTNKVCYNELACASLILQNDHARLLATNKDLVIPNHLGGLPGNGSFIKLLEEVNGVAATVIGKPSNIIMDLALEELGLGKNEVCMIGDNYDTDILSGINNGIDTIFVETGVHKISDLENVEHKPTYVIKNLSEYDLK